MNFKELLLPITFVLVITLSLNLYFEHRAKKSLVPPEQTTSGQMHEVAHDPEVVSPLDWQIEYAESDKQKEDNTTIATQYGQLTFNAAGATLDRLVFTMNNKVLTAFDAKTLLQKTFLVAFAGKTPYLYTLAEQHEDATHITLAYTYQLTDALFTKKFVINKHVPQIDLILCVETEKPLTSLKKLRIFYPSPTIMAINATEITAFVNDNLHPKSLNIYHKLDEILYKTWRKPTIFGAADQFFVYAMIADPQNLVYRGAFSAINEDRELLLQLETNEINKPGEWKLSFYLGPKELSFMHAVDPRLEQTLNYGFWTPLVKILLWILDFLHKYVKNYGLAIIIFTILFQLLLLPLSISGQKKMEEQKEFSRKLEYIKRKYHADPERLKQEQAELIRTHGIGGMFGGCLLLLVQLPFFFALSKLLHSCVQLHQERFLWIPDLATYDPFFILPILSFIVIAARAYTPSKPIRTQVAMFAGFLFLGAVTAKLPAGLVLFILTSTAANLAQTYILKLKKS